MLWYELCEIYFINDISLKYEKNYPSIKRSKETYCYIKIINGW